MLEHDTASDAGVQYKLQEVAIKLKVKKQIKETKREREKGRLMIT